MYDLHLPPILETLARRFQAAGAVLYAVGGVVRNRLLHVPPEDIDICSRLLPEEVVALCKAASIQVVEKAMRFGTVEIHIGGHAFEHTTFRGDVYAPGGGHRPSAVHFSATPEEDAFRRDFTCNALYFDILARALIDPTGGVADIQNKRLRATSADPHTILQDDGLRVLRLVRFASTLGFMIEPATLRAARDCVGTLAAIAWERKRDELSQILLADCRYQQRATKNSVRFGLMQLYELGALPYLLPELLEGEGVTQRAQYHAYDVLEHNIHACAAAPPTLTLRLAALLHDVGKPAALREKGLPPTAGGAPPTAERLTKTTPMLHHDVLGVPLAKAALERLRYPAAIIQDVLFLIEHHMYDLNGQAKEATLRARFVSFGLARTDMLCAIREADIRGSGLCKHYTATRWRALLARMQQEGVPFSLEALACTGHDIMRWLALPPGEEIGQIKQRLRRHCARHPQDNTNARLEQVARGMVAKRK